MHRNQNPGQNPRRNVEHEVPRDDELEDDETVPNFLTARELQAREPAKEESQQGDKPPRKGGEGKTK